MSLRCCTCRGVEGDRLNGGLFIIIADLGVEVAIPLAAGRACRAMTPDRTVVRDDEAISGRSSAADGLDIVVLNEWQWVNDHSLMKVEMDDSYFSSYVS